MLRRQPVDWPRIDDALLSIGRASYTATRFDKDFATLVTFLELPDNWDVVREGDADKLWDFQLRIAKRHLIKRQKQAAKAAEADEEVIGILNSARLARNELLHSMPALPLHRVQRVDPVARHFVWESPSELLEAPLVRLRSLVREIAPGTMVVGAWLHQVLEQDDEPFPTLFAEGYADAVTQWVLAPVWDLLPRLPDEPDRPRTDGVVWDATAHDAPTGIVPSPESMT